MPSFRWKIEKVPSCASTNTEVKSLLQQDRAQIGTVLITDNQLQGRGRLNRQWFSPTGNIALSAVFPMPSEASKVYQMNLVAAVSLARTIREYAGISTQIKWPNDVMVQGKKVAGILSEAYEDKAVIVGIGVNFNSTRADFPQDLRDGLTTLKDHSTEDLDSENFLNFLTNDFTTDLIRYQRLGLGGFLDEIHRLLVYRNQEVWITEEENQGYPAVVQGLDSDGFLVVKTMEGRPRTIVAADVRDASGGTSSSGGKL